MTTNHVPQVPLKKSKFTDGLTIEQKRRSWKHDYPEPSIDKAASWVHFILSVFWDNLVDFVIFVAPPLILLITFYIIILGIGYLIWSKW